MTRHRPTMGVNDLAVILDREARTLADDNWNAASVIVQQAAEKLRGMAAAMRAVGLNPDQ